jgi:transposase
VVQLVREKFTCRDCEKISQAPAPFHVLPRGFAGPSLLAMILFEKYGQHQPLNRQSERYAREGSISTCPRWPIRSVAALCFCARSTS